MWRSGEDGAPLAGEKPPDLHQEVFVSFEVLACFFKRCFPMGKHEENIHLGFLVDHCGHFSFTFFFPELTAALLFGGEKNKLRKGKKKTREDFSPSCIDGQEEIPSWISGNYRSKKSKKSWQIMID